MSLYRSTHTLRAEKVAMLQLYGDDIHTVIHFEYGLDAILYQSHAVRRKGVEVGCYLVFNNQGEWHVEKECEFEKRFAPIETDEPKPSVSDAEDKPSVFWRLDALEKSLGLLRAYSKVIEETESLVNQNLRKLEERVKALEANDDLKSSLADVEQQRDELQLEVDDFKNNLDFYQQLPVKKDLEVSKLEEACAAAGMTCTVFPRRVVTFIAEHETVGDDLFMQMIEVAMMEMFDKGIEENSFLASNDVCITVKEIPAIDELSESSDASKAD